jgi:arylsulfatase A-like enzyme
MCWKFLEIEINSINQSQMKNCHLLICFLIFSSLGLFAQKKSPNIVLIFSDDQGWNDVGCYGSEIPTPNIDRIATEGIKFNQFYSASAICTPSRYGLLTGRYPSRSSDQLLTALMFMTDEDQGIRAEETTIAEVLRDRGGYETALIGKWHLGHGDDKFLPIHHGFDYFTGHTGGCIDYFTMTYGAIPDWYHGAEHVSQDGYATDVITNEAVKYLEAQKDTDKPFFLYLPYNAPHFGKGYSPADKQPVNIMQPQAEDLLRLPKINDKVRREFAAMTVSLDDGVGKVLDALDLLDLSKNTLVIFITDHGGDPVYGGSNVPFRGVKASLFEGGIRVPALMRWPGKIDPGTISNATLSTLDLFPTFCKLANIEDGNYDLDGMDISATIFEGKDAGPRELFWELGGHQELDRKPWGALLSDQWKYVNAPLEGEFLFDLRQDPYETNDLSNSQHTKFNQMRQRWNKIAAECRN